MIVAEKLGMTLGELRRKMTLDELMLWSGFYELRDQQEKAHRQKMEMQAARRR